VADPSPPRSSGVGPSARPSAPTGAAPAPTPAADALLARARAVRVEGPAWWTSRRAEALARFAARGFPSLRDEDWKYTSLARLAATPWAPPDRAYPRAEVAARVQRSRLHLAGGLVLVFVDGRYAADLSVVPPQLGGVLFGSLADALRNAPSHLEPHLGRVAVGGDRPFADLSTAAFDDGVLLHATPGTCLPVPVEVLHVTTRPGTACFPRTLVVAATGSRLTLVEHHVALTDAPYLSLPVVEVSVAQHAAVEHVLWQEEADSAFHVASVVAHQARDSRFSSCVLTLGGALARTDVDVVLDGEGAEATLHGLNLVFGSRHADQHTRLDHAKPHGTSRQLYKTVLDGKAVGVFNGKVLVRPDAQKTDAQQAHHNLLLSAEATANTKPELEIYADDVKCAHGATVGRLDDEKLFYLRSRGLPEVIARDLLLRAFARDVTERIQIEAVRARLDRWMTERMPALAGREERT